MRPRSSVWVMILTVAAGWAAESRVTVRLEDTGAALVNLGMG
jgi:hypothetical protein